MNPHNVGFRMAEHNFRHSDPGTGAIIPYTEYNQVTDLVIAGTETNTIPYPRKAGQRQTIFCVSRSSGDRTITYTTAAGGSGPFTGSSADTSLVFNLADDFAVLESVHVGSDVYEWRVVAAEGAPASLGDITYEDLVATTLVVTGASAFTGAATYTGAVAASSTVNVSSINTLRTVSNGDGATNLIPNVQVQGTDKATGSLMIGVGNATNTSAVAPTLAFLKGGGADLDTATAVASGEILGEITWFGADGTDYESPAARIYASPDTTVSAGVMPGSLVFQTTAGGGETLTTALTVSSAQKTMFGGTTALTISDGDGATNLIPAVQIQGTTKATNSLLLLGNSATATSTVAPSINFAKGAHATLGNATTAVADNTILGEITWFGSDGTDFESPAARIFCAVDGTANTGDMPGELIFQTTTDGGETLVTALTIAPLGNVTASKGFIAKSNRAAAITGADTLTHDDSGGIFSVAKTSAYAITLPTPAQGLMFKFMVLDTGANIVTIAAGSNMLFGTVSVNNVSTAMTGTTLSLAATGSVGDWVCFEGIDATHYLVTGACIAAADITIA